MAARSTGPPARSGSRSPMAASVGRADRRQACLGRSRPLRWRPGASAWHTSGPLSRAGANVVTQPQSYRTRRGQAMHARCHIRNDQAGRDPHAVGSSLSWPTGRPAARLSPLNHQTYMQPVTDPVRRQERITIAWDSDSPTRYFTGETHTSLAARTDLLVTVKSETAERGSRY
jgi:hypothetical protein